MKFSEWLKEAKYQGKKFSIKDFNMKKGDKILPSELPMKSDKKNRHVLQSDGKNVFVYTPATGGGVYKIGEYILKG